MEGHHLYHRVGEWILYHYVPVRNMKVIKPAFVLSCFQERAVNSIAKPKTQALFLADCFQSWPQRRRLVFLASSFSCKISLSGYFTTSQVTWQKQPCYARHNGRITVGERRVNATLAVVLYKIFEHNYQILQSEISSWLFKHTNKLQT